MMTHVPVPTLSALEWARNRWRYATSSGEGRCEVMAVSRVRCNPDCSTTLQSRNVGKRSWASAWFAGAPSVLRSKPKKEVEIQAHAARRPVHASLEVALINALRKALLRRSRCSNLIVTRSDHVGAVNPSHAVDDADQWFHRDR